MAWVRFGKFTQIFLAIYLIEAGALLVIGPWTSWWDRNFFADLLPWLNRTMAHDGARIAVAAAGALTAIGGIVDLRHALRAWNGHADGGVGAIESP